MVSSKDLHLVGFQIGAEKFGVPIDIVHEIVRVPAITSVPEAPDFVEGVINLRGRIIPVVDLRKRFGEARIAANKKNRVIVAEVEDRLVGLLVDSASEVFKIPPGDVEPPPSLFGEGELNYVKGIARYRGQLIILVELARILQHGELKRLSTIADMAVAE